MHVPGLIPAAAGDDKGGHNNVFSGRRQQLVPLEAGVAGATVAAIVLKRDATQLGITLRGLRKLRRILLEEYKEAFGGMSTEDVNREWILKVTKKAGCLGCRLLEVQEVVDPADIAAPMYFISHAWKNKLALLLDYVLDNFLSDAAESTAVWADFLAVNQHSASETQAARCMQAFQDVVKVTAGTIVVMDIAACNPATRAWCIYEWAHTLATHGPDGFHARLGPADRAAVVGSLDIRQAQCSRADDKNAILATVKEQHGSAVRFNTMLKLQLLLEPLAYQVDMRRLLEQAAGTTWEFTAVKKWLRLGPAGARVLCIASGGGEGKSTISAVLCSKDQGHGFGGQIAAHHFLKYSDQRRLDAVRIIKSLAYQIARRIPAMAQQLLKLDVAEVAQMSDVEQQAFTKLLLEPLQQVALVRQEQVVLLIDALDEADPPELQLATSSRDWSACPKACGNIALQLISQHFIQLPPFVRFIFTARPDAAAGQMLPCLERTFPGSVLHTSPSALRSGNSSSGTRPTGVMVYHTAVAACDDAANAASSRPLLQEPQLDDVYAVYGRVFGSAHAQYGSIGAPSEEKPPKVVVGNLLAVLMAAKEPLSQAFLQQMGLGDAIALLPGYPKLFFVDEHHLYLVHKSLGDWLLNPATSGAFAAHVHMGHGQIGLHLAGLWWRQQQQEGAAAAAVGGGGSSSAYLLKYMVTHLAVAADASAAGAHGGKRGPSGPAAVLTAADNPAVQLDLLLQDFNFLSAVLEAGHGPAIIGALGAMGTHTEWSYEALRWLRSDLHNLVGKSAAALAEQALALAPGLTKVHQLAVKAACPPWTTRLVLPVVAGAWPACLAILNAHTDEVHCVAFSPDSRQLASGSSDTTVRIWDVATGRCTALLEGHKGQLTAVAFSPDNGRQIASCSTDKTLCLWDTATGQCTATLKGHTQGLTSLAFSLSGQHLASGSDDKTVRLWDTSTGLCTTTLKGNKEAVSCVAFSPDGRQLGVGCKGNTLRLWDITKQQCMARLEGHTDSIRSLAFSPDGQQLVSGSNDTTLRLWSTATGQCSATLESHSQEVYCVAFSPDGMQLASGSQDCTLRLWNTITGKCTATLEGPLSFINSVAFSPDGLQLVSSYDDWTLRLWDVTKGQSTTTPEGHTFFVSDVTFNPGLNSRQLASIGQDCTLRLWDTVTGDCTAILEGHTDGIRCMAFSPPDGRCLASGGGGDQTLQLWDTATGQRAAALVGHTEWVSSLAFSPDGQRLASGSGDKTLRLWDTATGQCTTVFSGHTAWVSSLAFSPDGQWLASGSDDKTLRLWDTATGQCTATMSGHTDTLCSVAFSPDGQQLVSGSDDTTLRLWDTVTGRCTATLAGHFGHVTSVAFSPDGRQLASGSSVRSGSGSSGSGSSSVDDWQTDSGGSSCGVDGRQLASSGSGSSGSSGRKGREDGTLRIWDAATGLCTATLEGHTEDVRSLAFSPDGRLLASGSADHTLRLWDTVSWQCTATLAGHTYVVASVAFSPDGLQLASASWDKTLRLWEAVSGQCTAALLEG